MHSICVPSAPSSEWKMAFPTRAAGLLLALSLACALVSGNKEFDVQHSVDGGKTFLAAGTIQQDIDSSGLELVRTSVPAPQDLASLLEQDGFYMIRVPTGKPGRFASASVRASCLAAGPRAEKLQLSLDPQGSVLSLSYALEGITSGACKASGAPAIPARSEVTVQQPEDGPTVLPPHMVQDTMSSPMFSAGEAGGPGRSAGGGPTDRPRGAPRIPASQGAASEVAAADGGAGEAAASDDATPLPEEKTWLQKNWLLVAGVSMAVMNLMGNLAKQAREPAPAAGAALARPGGGAPRR